MNKPLRIGILLLVCISSYFSIHNSFSYGWFNQLSALVLTAIFILPPTLLALFTVKRTDIYALICFIILGVVFVKFGYDANRRDLSQAEKNQEMIKNLPSEIEKTYKSLRKGDIFYPTKSTYFAIKNTIEDSLRTILNIPYSQITNDSIHTNIFLHIFHTMPYIDDTLQTQLYRSAMYNSLRIDTMLFSPNQDRFLGFMSYTSTYYDDNEMKNVDYGEYAIILGSIDNKTVRVACWNPTETKTNYPNQECAYYYTFNFMHDKLYEFEKINFTSKEYWSNPKTVTIEGMSYFSYEINQKTKKPYPILIVQLP
jgi:hypothetical protein